MVPLIHLVLSHVTFLFLQVPEERGMFWRENGRRQYVKCDVDRDVTPDVACDPPGLGRACACASRCRCVGRRH